MIGPTRQQLSSENHFSSENLQKAFLKYPWEKTRKEPVWPDLAIYWTLGNFLATINLHKTTTFLGNFCTGVEIF